MKKIIFILILTIFINNLYSSERIVLNALKLRKMIINKNLDIINKKDNLKQVKYQISEVKSAVYPTLNLEASIAGQNLYNVPDKDYYSYKINLVQPLYTYGKLSSAIDIAKKYYKTSELDYQLTKKNILLKSLVNLYTIRLLEEQIKILNTSKKSLSQHLQDTKVRWEAADITKVDYLRAKVAYEQINPKLLDLKSKIKDTKHQLKNLLNLKYNDILVIDDSIKVDKYLTLSLKELIKKALKNSETIKIFKNNKEIEKLQKVINKNSLRPNLNLVSFYGAESGDISNITGKDNLYAGIVLSFPLFDGFKSKNQVLQSNIKIKKIERNLKQYISNLTTNIIKQYDNLELYKNTIKVNKLVIESAEEALRIAKLSYKNGSGTNLEVLDAEKDLVSAKIELIASYYNYIVTELNLENLTGK